MTMTHVSTFESTCQKTMEWVRELKHLGRFADDEQAYTALRAVLQALRDRLTVEEAADLSAQLPMLVRGFYYEGWRPSATPVKIRRREDFLNAIDQKLSGGTKVKAESAARAVFMLLSERTTQGEIEDVKGFMPGPILELWPVEGGMKEG